MKCRNCSRDIPDNSIFCNWCGKKQLVEKQKETSVPRPRQLPSGSWSVQIMRGGKRVRITAPTESECIARAMSYKAELSEAAVPASSLTLHTAIEKYIQSSSGRLSPTTLQGYNSILRNGFGSLLSRRVSAITTNMLQKAVDDECLAVSPRTGKPYTPKTIANRYGLIATVLHEYAPSLKTSVRLPEPKELPIHILTPEQIYSVVRGTDIELPVLLSMWLSFSMSELRGLTKSGSIHGDQISVMETVVDVDGKPVRKSGGKEVKRSRTLNLPPYIRSLIDAVPGDVICPLSGQAMYKRFTRLLQANGLPHMTFHQLRHVNASVMAELNIPEKESNDRGGWKSSHVRQRVYTHSFSATRTAADAAIDARFNDIITHEIAHEIEKS